MSILEKELEPAPRRVMTLFYLVDSSGSMEGAKIGTVNAAMEECIPLLKEVAKANDDAEIKVAILQFSSGCSWITPESGPVNLNDFVWNDLTAGDNCDLGSAFIELNDKLSREKFLKSPTGHYAPVLILISNGEPTDDWESKLNVLQQNDWYKVAIKIAFDIESGSNRDVLAKFTNNVEAILEPKNMNDLKAMIYKISVRVVQKIYIIRDYGIYNPNQISTPENYVNEIVSSVVNEINRGENYIDINTAHLLNDWANW